MLDKLFKYTLNSQEKQFISIVENILEHENTSIKMTPISDKYYLINEKLHYYIMINEGTFQITNSNFTFAKFLYPKVTDLIILKIKDAMEADRLNFQQKIFKSETKMLDDVLFNIQNSK